MTQPTGQIDVRTAGSTDRPWTIATLRDRWTGTRIASRGRLIAADQLPAFIAGIGEERVGLATYCVDGDSCELVTLDSLRENMGIGTKLLASVEAAARSAGCKRLWLITTNDNLRALGFYQKRGLAIRAVHVNAIVESRRLKPSIPLIGMNGIPVCDEIELGKALET